MGILIFPGEHREWGTLTEDAVECVYFVIL